MADLAKILGDAVDALSAAKAKHPRTMPLPNGTGGGGRMTWMTIARNSCDRAFREGHLTHVEVFDEETAEVMAETDPVKLRAELMDVMATCLRWVEELDDAARSVVLSQRWEQLQAARPRCGHTQIVCTCGAPIAQCRCVGPKKTETVSGGCENCRRP